MPNRIVLLAVALMAMATGFWFAQNRNAPDISVITPEFQGRIVTPARKVVMPELVRDDGSAFDQGAITGHWSLMFFGYTNCPDICPTTLNVLAQAKKAAQHGFPEVIFVSVDPQRDTVDLLGEYVRYFDPAFTGVTGDADMLKALSLQTSVVYMPVAVGVDESGYLVEHSSSLLLFNPEGKLHAFLQAPHTSESILHGLNVIRGM